MSFAVNVWSMTVASLGERSPTLASCLDDSSVQRWMGSSRRPIIRILERPTPHMLIVSWCDAGSGHYGYQTWRAVIAREAGICMLNGRLINAGDAVYKPLIVGRTPTNAEAMICARSVGR